MTTKGKVLVLVSSGHGLPLKDGKVYTGAGYYLNELTVPVRALMKESYEITFANPKGNTPQMDVNSAIAQFFGGDEAKLQDYLKFRDTLTGLKNPTRISELRLLDTRFGGNHPAFLAEDSLLGLHGNCIAEE
jgi:hypothetical protein